jgi:hypothetical protein
MGARERPEKHEEEERIRIHQFKKRKYMGYDRPITIVDAIIYDMTYLHHTLSKKNVSYLVAEDEIKNDPFYHLPSGVIRR